MILIDAGPIIAIHDADDPHHAKCITAMKSLLQVQLITTWPCFTESMYFLGKIGGFPSQELLWSLCEKGLLIVHDSLIHERQRMKVLMEKFRDLPMDLADASLIAAAESLGIRKVFTLDKHFYAYRTTSNEALEIFPSGD